MQIKEVKETAMQDFEYEFKKLVRKAKQLGLEEPKYEIVQSHVPRPKEEVSSPREDPNYYVNILNIHDVNIILEGWVLAGIADNSLIIGKNKFEPLYSYFEDIPKDKILSDSTSCEHCNKKRYRKYTFILRNEETNEYKQVGSKCVEDFLETKTVSGLINYINSWYKSTIKWEEKEEKDCLYIMTDYLLPLAVEIIDKHGFQSIVSSDSSVERLNKFIKDDITALPEYVELSKKIQQYYEQHYNDNYNDYMRNAVNAVCSYSIVPSNTTLTYLLVCVREYFKEMSKVQTKKEYYGQIGEKYEFTDAQFLKSTTFNTMYGESLKASFIWKGYRISAITSINSRVADALLKMEKGTLVSFCATVKGQHEFKDEFYTDVSRVQLY